MTITSKRQAELLSMACEIAGLNTHIEWIEKKTHARTWAEKIAVRFRFEGTFPVKNTYLYCDTLDMCFFYNEAGTPCVTYAGCASVGSKDFTEERLTKAFKRAQELLNIMKELAEKEQ